MMMHSLIGRENGMKKNPAISCSIAVMILFFMTGGSAENNILIRTGDGGTILDKADRDSGHRDLTGDPAGETRTYRDSGLVITVIKMPDEITGHKTFEVTVENQNAVKKSLNGRICLFDLRIKQAECGSGECPVYMEIPAKSKETKKWNCKEKSFFSAWTFVIVQVYDY